MKISKVAKGTAKFFLDVPSWIGLNSIKQNGAYVLDQAKSVFVEPLKDATAKPEDPPKTFEEAIEEHGLTEEAIQKKIGDCRKRMVAYIGVSCVAIIYALSLLWDGYYWTAFLSSFIAWVPIAHVFRTHFIYVQLKTRRLGLTVEDWRHYLRTGQLP